MNINTELFLKKIRKTPKCWEWLAAKNAQGYGRFGVNGVNWLAPRVSWVLFNGFIPKDKCVLHRCDNPSCVNPSHLFIGSRTENNLDMVKKGRQRGAPGALNAHNKISDFDVLAIRKEYSDGGTTQKLIAKKYGISQAQVSSIVRKESWVFL